MNWNSEFTFMSPLPLPSLTGARAHEGEGVRGQGRALMRLPRYCAALGHARPARCHLGTSASVSLDTAGDYDDVPYNPHRCGTSDSEGGHLRIPPDMLLQHPPSKTALDQGKRQAYARACLPGHASKNQEEEKNLQTASCQACNQVRNVTDEGSAA